MSSTRRIALRRLQVLRIHIFKYCFRTVLVNFQKDTKSCLVFSVNEKEVASINLTTDIRDLYVPLSNIYSHHKKSLITQLRKEHIHFGIVFNFQNHLHSLLAANSFGLLSGKMGTCKHTNIHRYRDLLMYKSSKCNAQELHFEQHRKGEQRTKKIITSNYMNDFIHKIEITSVSHKRSAKTTFSKKGI